MVNLTVLQLGLLGAGTGQVQSTNKMPVFNTKGNSNSNNRDSLSSRANHMSWENC